MELILFRLVDLGEMDDLEVLIFFSGSCFIGVMGYFCCGTKKNTHTIEVAI